MSDFNEAMQAPEPPTGTPSAEDKQWALIAHLSALVGLVIPFGSIAGPLVVWLIKKEQLPFAADQAKEALNFNITVAIAGFALIVLTFLTLFILSPLTGLLGLALVVAWLVFVVIAAIKTNEGVAYRYPFILRLIK